MFRKSIPITVPQHKVCISTENITRPLCWQHKFQEQFSKVSRLQLLKPVRLINLFSGSISWSYITIFIFILTAYPPAWLICHRSREIRQLQNICLPLKRLFPFKKFFYLTAHLVHNHPPKSRPLNQNPVWEENMILSPRAHPGSFPFQTHWRIHQL